MTLSPHLLQPPPSVLPAALKSLMPMMLFSVYLKDRVHVFSIAKPLLLKSYLEEIKHLSENCDLSQIVLQPTPSGDPIQNHRETPVVSHYRVPSSGSIVSEANAAPIALHATVRSIISLL